MLVDDEGFAILGEDECFELLASCSIGRVGVAIGAIPAIFPVNFCLSDRTIFFRTAPGTKLSAALREADVAFEVDRADAIYHQGWSVLAVGKCYEVTEEAVLERVTRLPLEPWAPGNRSHVVRIDPDFVSGRRIVSAPKA
jgi:nitroimidazol reductase NimA-like FMN-containing flavoprotein (pyridoxamine 5'-phosphate oxidase superfamily)